MNETTTNDTTTDDNDFATIIEATVTALAEQATQGETAQQSLKTIEGLRGEGATDEEIVQSLSDSGVISAENTNSPSEEEQRKALSDAIKKIDAAGFDHGAVYNKLIEKNSGDMIEATVELIGLSKNISELSAFTGQETKIDLKKLAANVNSGVTTHDELRTMIKTKLIGEAEINTMTTEFDLNQDFFQAVAAEGAPTNILAALGQPAAVESSEPNFEGMSPEEKNRLWQESTAKIDDMGFDHNDVLAKLTRLHNGDKKVATRELVRLSNNADDLNTLMKNEDRPRTEVSGTTPDFTPLTPIEQLAGLVKAAKEYQENNKATLGDGRVVKKDALMAEKSYMNCDREILAHESEDRLEEKLRELLGKPAPKTEEGKRLPASREDVMEKALDKYWKDLLLSESFDQLSQGAFEIEEPNMMALRHQRTVSLEYLKHGGKTRTNIPEALAKAEDILEWPAKKIRKLAGEVARAEGKIPRGVAQLMRKFGGEGDGQYI